MELLWDLAGHGSHSRSSSEPRSVTEDPFVVSSLAFHPSGERLASGSQDRTIKIWDLETGCEVISLQKQIGRINALAFSPDGEILASGSAGYFGSDNTVALWDARADTALRLRRARAYARDAWLLARLRLLTEETGYSGEQVLEVLRRIPPEWDRDAARLICFHGGHEKLLRAVAKAAESAADLPPQACRRLLNWAALLRERYADTPPPPEGTEARALYEARQGQLDRACNLLRTRVSDFERQESDHPRVQQGQG